MKNPWVAAILNLLFFGGGYIYNGRRVGIGAGMVLAWILIRIGEISIFLTHLVFEKWLIMFTGMVIMQFTFAADAYREAKSISAGS